MIEPAVEAGAGSGKTAIPGRPRRASARGRRRATRIAAVTFTTSCASELLFRVRSTTTELAEGRVPTELRTALRRESEAQRACLQAAEARIDEITARRSRLLQR
jgi:ATP-dependent exoDNAse (exonuclease V) beta subunit